MLRSFAVILSEAKDLRSSFRIKSAKHVGSSPVARGRGRKNNCRDSSPRKVGAQDDSGWGGGSAE
jgi:hypothetical protein